MRPLAAGLILGLALAGCPARPHLGPGFGASARVAFLRQSVRAPEAAVPLPPTTLDSQESAAIWGGYLGSLLPRGRELQAGQGAILVGLPPPDGLMTRQPAAPVP